MPTEFDSNLRVHVDRFLADARERRVLSPDPNHSKLPITPASPVVYKAQVLKVIEHVVAHNRLFKNTPAQDGAVAHLPNSPFLEPIPDTDSEISRAIEQQNLDALQNACGALVFATPDSETVRLEASNLCAEHDHIRESLYRFPKFGLIIMIASFQKNLVFATRAENRINGGREFAVSAMHRAIHEEHGHKLGIS